MIRLLLLITLCVYGIEAYSDDYTADKEAEGFIWCKVTAYTPWDEGCSGYAAYGSKDVRSTTVRGYAVDCKAIPYGSKIYVQGYGWGVSDDTGSAMRKSWKQDGIVHIDIRVYSTAKAKEWGVKWLWVKIIP